MNVTIDDLSRWTAQQHTQIIQALRLHIPESESDYFGFETERKSLKSDPEKTACILFDEEKNTCSIRYSRPISCQAFPLSYTGEKFILADKACPGIGQGEVSREALKESRDLAEQEYKERISTLAALPGVYSVITTHMLRESARAMESMSEEDKQRLQDIMTKQADSEQSDEKSD